MPMLTFLRKSYGRRKGSKETLMVNQKGGELKEVHMKRDKPPGFLTIMVNSFTHLLSGERQSDTKCSNQSPETHTMEKDDPCDKTITSVNATVPIFETKSDGSGRLTVPLNYDSTVDDLAMTPAGVYVEDMSRSERKPSRPVDIWWRRLHLTRGFQNTAPGHAESTKGRSKHKKGANLNNPRMDAVNDDSAMMDDCHLNGYREFDFDEPIDSYTMSESCVSCSPSTSSFGSASSFYDAPQDAPVMQFERTNSRRKDTVNERLSLSMDGGFEHLVDSCLMRQGCVSSSFSTSSVESASIFYDASQDAVVIEASVQGSIGTSPPSLFDFLMAPSDTATQLSAKSNGVSDGTRSKTKCDIESDPSEYVMFTDYDVSNTPHASPARRRPSRSLCEAFSYVWHGQCTDEENEDDDEESNSDQATDADGKHYLEDDFDDDDDCVVFCEEYDDDDDSCSSSGFEDKKVRFNMKPVVHVMRTWDFAYRQARKGEWEMAARDRGRFRKHIEELEPVLEPALQPSLREKIYSERFSGKGTSETETLNRPPCNVRRKSSVHLV